MTAIGKSGPSRNVASQNGRIRSLAAGPRAVKSRSEPPTGTPSGTTAWRIKATAIDRCMRYPKNHVQRFPRKRLLKNSTSPATRAAAPPVVVGAGVVGIMSGFGVRSQLQSFQPKPSANTAPAK